MATINVDEGSYSVTVTDGNSCSVEDNISVINDGNPLNLNLEVDPDTICEGESTSIQDLIENSNGKIEYTWNEGLSGAGPHSISPSSTTNYKLDVVDSLGCSGHAEIEVVVNELPHMMLMSNSEINEFCNGDQIVITASPSGLTDYTYFVDGVETTTGVSGREFRPGGLPSGEYTIKVIGNNGCEGETELNITVHENPLVEVSEEDITICFGEEVLLQVKDLVSGLKYAWHDENDSLIGSGSSVTIKPSSDMLYTVTAMDEATGCSSTDDIQVMVFPLPISSFVYEVSDLHITCMAATANNLTNWTWNFGDRTASVSGIPNVEHDYNFHDTYEIKLIVENTCGEDTLDCPVVLDGSDYEGDNCEQDVEVGVQSQITNHKSNFVSVYPNPFSEKTTLKLTLPTPERLIIDVTDLQGRVLARISDDIYFERGEHFIPLDLTDKGMKLLIIKSEERIISMKKLISF